MSMTTTLFNLDGLCLVLIEKGGVGDPSEEDKAVLYHQIITYLPTMTNTSSPNNHMQVIPKKEPVELCSANATMKVALL